MSEKTTMLEINNKEEMAFELFDKLMKCVEDNRNQGAGFYSSFTPEQKQKYMLKIFSESLKAVKGVGAGTPSISDNLKFDK